MPLVRTTPGAYYADYPEAWGSYGYNGTSGHHTFKYALWGLGLVRGTYMATSYNVPPIREQDVVNPSDMIAMGDAILFVFRHSKTAGLEEFADHTLAASLVTNSPTGQCQRMRMRHAGQYNVLFCDGHVETLKPTQLLDRSKPAVMRRQPHPEMDLP